MAGAIRKVIASCNLIRYKAKQKEKKNENKCFTAKWS